MKICIIIFTSLFFISCSKKNDQFYIEKLNGKEFIIKDTLSTIIIKHCDITECLDAEIDSGKLYFSKDIFEKIKKTYRENGNIPNQHDLYLTGKNNIVYELFDTTLCPKMENKYLVKGKVIGYKSYGLVFKINSYELIETQHNGQ